MCKEIILDIRALLYSIHTHHKFTSLGILEANVFFLLTFACESWHKIISPYLVLINHFPYDCSFIHRTRHKFYFSICNELKEILFSSDWQRYLDLNSAV